MAFQGIVNACFSCHALNTYFSKRMYNVWLTHVLNVIIIIIIILYLKKVTLLVKDYSTKRPSISHKKFIQYHEHDNTK